MIDRAVIIAGGGGKRLWPWTGPTMPKPLLPLGGGGRSLLSATLDRLAGLLPHDAITIQASESLGRRLVEADGRLTLASLGPEPSARDTGPAIALAMRRVLDRTPESIVAILPADHRVEDVDEFARVLRVAGEAARSGALVTLGIKPDHASSAFGYIELGERLEGRDEVRSIARFVEKPDPVRAQEFVDGGRHLWNGGIFVWQAQAFWRALSAHAPGVAGPVERYVRSGESADWDEAERTSIDYALMERADSVVTVPLDAGWNDIGGWEAVAELARRGDAGPARIAEIRGPLAEGSLALVVEDSAGPLVGASEEPLIIVRGPEGTLLARRGEDAQLKPHVP